MQCFSNFIWIVTEPVTYCGTGNNKRQSFHDCTRLLESFLHFKTLVQLFLVVLKVQKVVVVVELEIFESLEMNMCSLKHLKTSCIRQKSKKQVFPRLYTITRKVFCVPATTAGVERLFSIAGFLLGCRRLGLSDANFEEQILAQCYLDIPAKQMKKRKSCAN